MNRISFVAALTIAIAFSASQASAFTGGRATGPVKFSAINRSSPSAVRAYLTPYQSTTKSMGFYAPWAVQNPYGMHMRGNPAQRAVACGC
jgi:hypothetical protein